MLLQLKWYKLKYKKNKISNLKIINNSKEMIHTKYKDKYNKLCQCNNKKMKLD